MAASVQPIYTRTWDVQVGGNLWGNVASTSMDGTSNTINATVIYVADPTEGSFVQKVILRPISTVAATVVRVFYCSANGAFTLGTTNTANNTGLVGEVGVAAWTVSQTAAAPAYDIPLNMGMNANTKLIMTVGTATGATTTGFNPVVVAGKY